MKFVFLLTKRGYVESLSICEFIYKRVIIGSSAQNKTPKSISWGFSRAFVVRLEAFA
jgi:hypothetical protein